MFIIYLPSHSTCLDLTFILSINFCLSILNLLCCSNFSLLRGQRWPWRMRVEESTLVIYWLSEVCIIICFILWTIRQQSSGFVQLQNCAHSYCWPRYIHYLPTSVSRWWSCCHFAWNIRHSERMLTSVSPFFFTSLLMVSMYLNFGLPLGLTLSTSMSSTVLVIWLSSLRLTCPY